MWFAFALFTVFAWGGSDMFSKKGTRPDDKHSHLRLIISVGTIMTIHAVCYLIFTGMEYSPISIIGYLPVSAMYILSMTFGYMGLRYIEVSVSSPICNSSGAVTALLIFVFLGERMSGLQLVGVVIITSGVILLAVLQRRKAEAERIRDGIAPGDKKYRIGFLAILFPVLYAIIDGLGSFMDAYFLEFVMDEDTANISYEFTFGICALFSYLYLRFVKKDKFSYIKEKDFTFGALCETAGQFTYINAMSDNAIVAAPMIASYSIFSILLSRIFLKEKLKKEQYAAVAVVMVGIAILGFADA